MYVLTLFALFLSAYAGNEELSDKYVCSQSRCTQASLNPNDHVRYDSLELCRLICSGYGTLWPLPTVSVDLGHMVMEVDPSKIQVILESAPVQTRNFIGRASDLFFARMYSKCANSTARSSMSIHIHVRVSSPEIDLTLNTDESYVLNIKSYGKNIEVEINATTVFGFRHSLETLLQLTAVRERHERCSILMLTKAKIADRPVFRHRGLLIDTSRTFLPVEDIQRTLDAMASVKLNVLHWHATDTHSFPLAFDTMPQFAKYGAYSPSKVYTTTDMKMIVDYAKMRGVKVILEIDSPGHAGNGWQFSQNTTLGNLVLCINKQPWQQYCVQPPCGQMNPANQNIYKVLSDMYKEVSTLFQKEHFHFGGDEVHLPCWMQSDEISAYMEEQGLPKTEEGYVSLWSEFHHMEMKAWDRAVGDSKTKGIVWSSQLTSAGRILEYLDPKRFIVQSWADASDPLPQELMAKGFSVIYSTRDAWYLDHGFWGGTTYHNWMKVYDYQIPYNEKVLGGEVCMWGEYASSNNLDVKIWPRAAALAERLWSSPSTKAQSATYRLLAQSERLKKLKINVDQITPEWCYLNEGQC